MTWSFFIGELLGVVFIFLGFLVSIEVFSDVRLPFTHIVLRRRERTLDGADRIGRDPAGSSFPLRPVLR